MKTVNALKVRNQFGEVLEMLDAGHEPVLIEKRKKVRAVLISYEDFRTRFVDKLADAEKERALERMRAHTAPSGVDMDPVESLRALRGYED